MSSGLDAIPNIDHCQQLVLSYAILNHIVLHSALHHVYCLGLNALFFLNLMLENFLAL